MIGVEAATVKQPFLKNKELPAKIGHQTVLSLVKMGQFVTSSLELDEVLTRVMDEVSELLQAEGVVIALLEDEELVFSAVCGPGASRLQDYRMPRDEGIVGRVVTTGKSVWRFGKRSNAPDVEVYRQAEEVSEFRSEALLAAPLRAEGMVIGVLEAAHSRPNGFKMSDLPVLEAAADWAAIAIANAQWHTQAQEARGRQALLEERARVARELHDAVTQTLYSMALMTTAHLRALNGGAYTVSRDDMAELDSMVQQALREARLLVYEFRPAELEEAGLIGALNHRLAAVERRSGLEAHLKVIDADGRPLSPSADVHLPPAVEEGLFRIAQEALNNALKHAGATLACVFLKICEEAVTLEVRDNGHGFDLDEVLRTGSGFGLIGMRERAEKLGGRLVIDTSPAKGTAVRVVCKLPSSNRRP